MVDLFQPLGQAALHHIGPELGAVGGVAHPLAPDGQVLPRGHPGHRAHHRHLLLPCVQAEDGVAVFLVLKNNGGDRPLQHRLLSALLVHTVSSSLVLWFLVLAEPLLQTSLWAAAYPAPAPGQVQG